MFEFFGRLFDPTGFVPRKDCGDWPAGLIWLHVGSDLFIWLAYISIPLVLVYFTRRRGLPFPGLFYLFAAFILACGFTHFIDALMFEVPLYNLAGLVKFVTAGVSWATVIALVPVVPRVTELIAKSSRPGDETTLHRALGTTPSGRSTDYIIAVLAGVLALLLRAAIDPFIGSDHFFVLSLLAVVFVSWQCGFGPGLLTLAISMIGTIYFFVPPRQSFIVEGQGNQIAVAMFFFCGVACAALGETQRQARKRVRAALNAALAQRAELEAEVTRRKVAEADLLETNARLRASEREAAAAAAQLDTFLLNAPVGIAFFDPALRYVRINRVFADANGRSVGAHIGRKVKEVIPEFPAELLADYRKVLDTGKPILDRLILAGRDTTNPGASWQVSMFPVRTGTGDLLGLGVVGRDVTEQLRAEQRVRESETTLRAFYDNSPLYMGVVEPTEDGDVRHVYDNRASCGFFGVPPDHTTGRLASELGTPPEVAARWLKKYAESERTGGSVRFEYEFAAPDGPRWLAATVSPLGPGPAGRPRFCYVAEDVTDRRRGEADLRASEARFRSLTESIPQMVWNADAAGHITYFNTRWREYTGLTAGAALDSWWQQVVHPDDSPTLQAAWETVVAGDKPSFTHEARVRRAGDGAYRWFQAAVVPLRHPDGRVDQWIGSLSDIDDQKQQAEMLEGMVRSRTAALVDEIEERKRAEQQVQVVAAELRRSNEELEKFAYVASHDLQEPLRKIQAFGDRLKTKCRDQLPDTGQEYVDRMLTSAGRMRRLIDDLLTFSRITTQGRAFAQVDLHKLVGEVVADLDERLEQTGGTAEVGPLPTIDADPSQMRQLFQNLVSNALKFHKPGVPPVVRVWGELVTVPGPNGEPPVDSCRITVQDNGIGFDEKYLDRIFQVFQRLHGREEYEGTGVGLAICRKIVERHGGTITAQSRVGEGAAFVVTLPTRQPNEGEP